MTATEVKRRRGNETVLQSTVPAVAEIIYNTTRKNLAVGDGAKAGGFAIPNHQDIQNGTYDYALAGGTENAIEITTPEMPSSYVSGQRVRVKIASTNTGAATLKWGALAAVGIRKWSGGSLVALTGSELRAGMIVTFDYDGTFWVISISGSGGGVVVTRQIFTSSGTWTKPSGLLYADVEVIGGGGGGSGNAGVGATGGTSSFGTHCSATGGAGANATVAGGVGGIGSGGDINVRGGTGMAGVIGGFGGASPLGAGGFGASLVTGSGGAGGQYGGGGGGGSTGGVHGAGGSGGGYAKKLIAETSLASTVAVTVGAGGAGFQLNAAAGAGAAGVVIVTEYRSA